MGKKLRILLMDQATVHRSLDNWQTTTDTDSEESGWYLQYLDLPTDKLAVGREIVFTSPGRTVSAGKEITSR